MEAFKRAHSWPGTSLFFTMSFRHQPQGARSDPHAKESQLSLPYFEELRYGKTNLVISLILDSYLSYY